MNIEVNSTTDVMIVSQTARQGLLSNSIRVLIELTNDVAICSILGVFGMVANLINMTVFIKQGLNTTVNLSLFSLSLSDFFGLSALVWLCTTQNPFVYNADSYFYPEEFGYLIGAWPHACFARATCWLTAYITAERCLCIALPLKSKQIITPRRTALILSVIYLWTFALLAPQYGAYYLDWQFYAKRNKSILRLKVREELYYLDNVSYFLNTSNGIFSFAAVTIFTIVLIIKLKQQRAWRKTTVAETDRSKTHRVRDKKTMFMVLVISIVLMCCYFPGIVSSLVTFINPDYKINGTEEEVFVATWSFFFILETINSSVNIFFYYSMSTKYKKTFATLFLKCGSHTNGTKNSHFITIVTENNEKC